MTQGWSVCAQVSRAGLCSPRQAVLAAVQSPVNSYSSHSAGTESGSRIEQSGEMGEVDS